MPAPIVYVEIPAPELEEAIAFYSGVFGWEITRSDHGQAPYASFSAGEGLAGGLCSARPVQPAGGVLVYLRVEELESTLSTLKLAGGDVVRPPEPVGPGLGFSAEFRDPAGSRLGLWAQA